MRPDGERAEEQPVVESEPGPMTALRLAATVAHALPGVRLRLRAEGHTLLEVRRDGSGTGQAPAMGPCAFRRAVARLHEARKAGQQLSILGLGDERALSIDVGVARGDRALIGGLYRIAVEGGDLHAFATPLSPRRCREVMAAGETSIRRHPSVIEGPVLHRDVATEVTIVHLLVPRQASSPPERHPLLDDLLAGCAVAEIEDALAVATR